MSLLLQKEGGKNFALTNKKKRTIELLKRRIERRLTKVTRWEAERVARKRLIQETLDRIRLEKAPKASGRGRKPREQTTTTTTITLQPPSLQTTPGSIQSSASSYYQPYGNLTGVLPGPSLK